ncbi:hypothetical protein ACFYO2_48325 [Streptomyces sp. NPDC006602]|uniref:hypothetical protein n=1 Tax=Streptomyces sp. NPDC006602 TaxID=3364751 RepID=UPI0036B8528F
MLLAPPGLPGEPEILPHWPCAQAVDRALAAEGVPPGAVRVGHSSHHYGVRMFLRLVWDVSRTGGLGGIRLYWEEETGWAYALTGPSTSDILEKKPAAPLHRIFATPQDVAEMAGRMVRGRHRPSGEYRGEWEQAPMAREAIEVYRRPVYG